MSQQLPAQPARRGLPRRQCSPLCVTHLGTAVALGGAPQAGLRVVAGGVDVQVGAGPPVVGKLHGVVRQAAVHAAAAPAARAVGGLLGEGRVWRRGGAG